MVTAQNRAPVGEVTRSAAKLPLRSLKVNQPADRFLGSKRLCWINPKRSAGGDVETAGREPERRPSLPSPSSLSSLLLLLGQGHTNACALGPVWTKK